MLRAELPALGDRRKPAAKTVIEPRNRLGRLRGAEAKAMRRDGLVGEELHDELARVDVPSGISTDIDDEPILRKRLEQTLHVRDEGIAIHIEATQMEALEFQIPQAFPARLDGTAPHRRRLGSTAALAEELVRRASRPVVISVDALLGMPLVVRAGWRRGRGFIAVPSELDHPGCTGGIDDVEPHPVLGRKVEPSAGTLRQILAR